MLQGDGVLLTGVEDSDRQDVGGAGQPGEPAHDRRVHHDHAAERRDEPLHRPQRDGHPGRRPSRRIPVRRGHARLRRSEAGTHARGAFDRVVPRRVRTVLRAVRHGSAVGQDGPAPADGRLRQHHPRPLGRRRRAPHEPADSPAPADRVRTPGVPSGPARAALRRPDDRAEPGRHRDTGTRPVRPAALDGAHAHRGPRRRAAPVNQRPAGDPRPQRPRRFTLGHPAPARRARGAHGADGCATAAERPVARRLPRPPVGVARAAARRRVS